MWLQYYKINEQLSGISYCYKGIYMMITNIFFIYNLRPGVYITMRCPVSNVNVRRQMSFLKPHFDDSLICR